MHCLTPTTWVNHSASALLQSLLTTICSSANCSSSEVADWLQVAIVPNTLAFNHVLAALHKAAAGTPTPEVRVALAESGVSLFHQMLNRGRTPPDTTTFDTLMALLTSVGAAGQALHVHQLKMQQVCTHGAYMFHCCCCQVSCLTLSPKMRTVQSHAHTVSQTCILACHCVHFLLSSHWGAAGAVSKQGRAVEHHCMLCTAGPLGAGLCCLDTAAGSWDAAGHCLPHCLADHAACSQAVAAGGAGLSRCQAGTGIAAATVAQSFVWFVGTGATRQAG